MYTSISGVMKCLFITCIMHIFISAAFTIHVDDCGSKVGHFTNFSISECEGSQPVCILKRNTNVTISIAFTTSVTDTAVKVVVHGIVQGIPVPFPVPNPDACVRSGLTCPLQPGKTYNYIAKFPVLKSYPKVHLNVKWELVNENDKDIVCGLIPVEIK